MVNDLGEIIAFKKVYLFKAIKKYYVYFIDPPLVVSFIGLSWVAYALLGFVDGVYDYIAWKIHDGHENISRWYISR